MRSSCCDVVNRFAISNEEIDETLNRIRNGAEYEGMQEDKKPKDGSHIDTSWRSNPIL